MNSSYNCRNTANSGSHGTKYLGYKDISILPFSYQSLPTRWFQTLCFEKGLKTHVYWSKYAWFRKTCGYGSVVSLGWENRKKNLCRKQKEEMNYH